MLPKSLGETIKEARLKLGHSLRKFAELVGVAPAFMSDIELGRRFPSDDVLQKIAGVLGIPFPELKALDGRESVTEIKRMVQGNAQWGLAFRTFNEQVKKNGMTPEEFVRKMSELKPEDENR
jgi:transcriptional regulator with XRE-family HTH domain